MIGWLKGAFRLIIKAVLGAIGQKVRGNDKNALWGTTARFLLSTISPLNMTLSSICMGNN